MKIDNDADIVDLVVALGAQLSQPVDVDVIKRSLVRGPSQPLLDRLVAAATASGLRVSPRHAAPGDLGPLLHSGLPIVIVGESGAEALVGVRGQRVRRLPRTPGAPAEWVSVNALADTLGPPAEAGWPLLLVDPALPASALAMPHDPNGADVAPWRRLVRLALAERADIVAVIITSLAVGLLTLVTPLVVQVLINNVAFGALSQPIVVLSAILLVCVGLAGGLRVVQRQVVEALQRRLFVRLVADLAHRLPRVSSSAFQKHYGPELVNRFFDVLTVQKAAKSLLLDGVSAALQATVGLALLAFYHPVLLAFAVALIIVVIVIFIPLGAGAERTAVAESKAKYAVAGWLEELARNPLMFRSAEGAALAVDRADSLARRYLGYRQAHFRIFLRQYGGTVALQAVAGAGLLLDGGALVIERQLSLGQLVASEFVVASVLSALIKFSEKLEVYYDLTAAVDKLGHLVELPTERTDGATPPPPPGPAALSVHALSYGHGDGHTVLNGINLKLRPGDRVVIDGPSGAGKSTLGALLFGMHPIGPGHVMLDSNDLRDLQPSHLRGQVRLANGVEVLAGSIAENIHLGGPPLEGGRLRALFAAVGLLPRIGRLPEGADTVLSPTGAPLSSGELRRLMVARAIAAGPRLLVIDDLLDGLAEADQTTLLDALSPPTRGWTLLVLTRNPSLAGRFDRRLHLDADGRLHERTPTTPPVRPEEPAS